MSKELAKTTIQSLYKEDAVVQLANFDMLNALLNQPAPKKWVKKNPYAGNSLYLPIDKVEYLLRKIYKRYRVEILREQQMFNAVSVTIRLHYLHPITNEWDWIDGGGAKSLQLKKGSQGFDFSNINTNSVDMAFPIAISQAIKNAAQKLGRIFGADLNRNEIMEVSADEGLQDKKYEIERDRMLSAIENGYQPTEEEIIKFKLDEGV